MITKTAKRIQVAVDRALLAALDKVAEESGCHRSHVIDLALRDFLHQDQRTFRDIKSCVDRVQSGLRAHLPAAKPWERKP